MKNVISHWIIEAYSFTMFFNVTLCYENCTKPSMAVYETRPAWFNITIPQDYNKRLSPAKNGCPTHVSIGIFPLKIGDINLQSMTFEVDMYLVIRWRDHRLNYTETRDSNSIIILHTEEAERLWCPVVSFRNAMGHEGVIFNPHSDSLRIKDNQISFMVRRVEKFHCSFDFRSYPMDSHNCFVEIQATNYKSSVMLQYQNGHSGVISNSIPTQFDVSGFNTGVCSREDGNSEIYSCVEYRFNFKRQLAHFVMLTYLPSFLIVVLSWVSFWLDVNASPPRIALGLTTMLTLVTMFTGAQQNLPPVSYLKAIDVWMFACIFMVFAGLIEYAAVNYTTRYRKMTTTTVKAMIQKKDVHIMQGGNPADNPIDRISRILFPASFMVFNIIYWPVYNNSS